MELAAGEGVDRVREQVRQHDLTDAVVVVSITGEGDPVTPAAVEEAALSAGALLARVTDHRAVGGDTDATDTDVEFGDPDAAVRERVREMDLSQTARRLDETVRDGALPDSNVRDRVASLVDDAVAEGSLADAADADAETNAADAPENGAPDDQVSMEDFQ